MALHAKDEINAARHSRKVGQPWVKNLLKSTLESESLKLLSELKLVHSAGRLFRNNYSKIIISVTVNTLENIRELQ